MQTKADRELIANAMDQCHCMYEENIVFQSDLDSICLAQQLYVEMFLGV